MTGQLDPKYKEEQRAAAEAAKKDDTSSLHKLGDHGNKYRYNSPGVDLLETFKNTYPDRKYVTQFIFNEFTSLCPKTGQPDFATIALEYIPRDFCIETKSLKVYYLAFRNEGSFMETITNKILEDCVKVCNPWVMKITSNFNARGGTLINVVAEYRAEDFKG